MTRLDSPLQRSDSCSVMERSSRNASRRGSTSQHTDTRKERDHSSTRAIFKRANAFLSRDQEPQDGSPPTPMRYYERGHPLPSNCSPERKATIPFRNPDLGLPSYRRRCDALNCEATSGLSPQRHMPYSNFRRGESQSRASPRSGSPRSTNVSPQRQLQSRSSSHRRGSASQRHGTSYTSSRQASGKCSPRRRDSVVSHTHSPSRSSVSNKYTESSRGSHKRTPSQSSYGHSLDSEKLYQNLKSIASSAESDSDFRSERNGRLKRSKSHMPAPENDRGSRNSFYNNSQKSGRNTGRNSRDFSPPGSDDINSRSHFSQKGSARGSGYNSYNSGRNTRHNTGHNTACNSHDSSPSRRDESCRSSQKLRHYRTDKGEASDRHSRRDLSQSEGSWHGSAHSPKSPASLSSSSRNVKELPNNNQALTVETDNPSTDRSRSTIRRGLEALILSENTRSSSQPSVPEMTIEDYVVIADIPRVNLYPEEEEGIFVRRRPQSRSPRRDNQQREGREGYGEHEEPEERGRGRERGRDRRERERRRLGKENGCSSETNSIISGASQRSKEELRASKRHERKPCDQPQMQLDSVDFKKGWMSMLDDSAEWRKFWFVLDNSGLKYYSDPEAEERDEPDGEIDVRYFVKVVEFEADKNYGLQLLLEDGEVTLSVMTSRIRRNWMEVLRRRIRASESADNRQPHYSSGSDKENSTTQNASFGRSSGSEVSSPCREGAGAMSSPSTHRREAGVGRDRDHEKRLEDRTKWFQEGTSDRESGESPWDKVELKKGTASSVANITPQISDGVVGLDIERRWEDFERIPVGEMGPIPPSGSSAPQATNEALQREVLSLKQQIEALRKGRVGLGSATPCGLNSACASRLEAVEKEHRERLQEVERQHERERREMESQRDQLLREEAENAVRAMETLRNAHQVELERLRGGNHTDAALLSSESLSLQQELDRLSVRYSQRCVELSRMQQSTGQKHTQIQNREKDIEQLRKENQDLKARLTEEMSLMRSLITGQRSGVVPISSYERSSSELEMLLRVKENEIEYLNKEISCLRNEIQALNKEKHELSERFKAVFVELSGIKGISEREIGSLKEHLRLTNAALEEEEEEEKEEQLLQDDSKQ